jgi:hypothetical protein
MLDIRVREKTTRGSGEDNTYGDTCSFPSDFRAT